MIGRNDPSEDLVLEERFAIVPEWLLDADVGDAAVRLYAVLLRYGQSTGARMPSRSTLARRLRKRSTDSVDRAMKELVGIGAVRIEHRYDGPQRLTNSSTSARLGLDAPTPLPVPTQVAANLLLPRSQGETFRLGAPFSAPVRDRLGDAVQAVIGASRPCTPAYGLR